jgi:hypothetical protein
MKIGPYSLHTLELGSFGLDGGAMFGIVPKTLWQKENPSDEENRIDMRTQNQVDLIYEENTVMKKDMKAMKVDIMTTKTLSQKNKKDITSIKAHVGMKR